MAGAREALSAEELQLMLDDDFGEEGDWETDDDNEEVFEEDEDDDEVVSLYMTINDDISVQYHIVGMFEPFIKHNLSLSSYFGVPCN